MLGLSLRATAVVGLLMLPPIVSTTTIPAIAHETDDDEDAGNVGRSELRDFLREMLQARGERRDALMDLLEARRDRRGALRSLLEGDDEDGGGIA